MGKLVDKVLGLMGYQEIEAVTEEETSADSDDFQESGDPGTASRRNLGYQPAPARKHARLVNFPGNGTNASYRLVVTEIRDFEEVQKIADSLKRRQAVIANLNGCNPDVAHKVVDFLSGATYALDGRAQKVAQGVYLFAPSNVNVEISGGILPWDRVLP